LVTNFNEPTKVGTLNSELRTTDYVISANTLVTRFSAKTLVTVL